MAALLWACTSLPWAYAGASAAGYEMRSSVVVGGQTQAAFAWCDAPGFVFAVSGVRGSLTRPQPARLITWLKGVQGGPNIDTIELGAGEGAAGSVFYPIGGPGQKPPLNDDLRLSNIENVQDPAYRMTRVSSFRLANKEYPCRYVKDAAFLGVTAKRTVIIWDNGKTATYATRNFDGTPGAYVTGGRKIDFGSETGWGYEFTTRDGYRYAVSAGNDMRPERERPPLSAEVSRGGWVLLTEPFLAYSVSRPRVGGAK